MKLKTGFKKQLGVKTEQNIWIFAISNNIENINRLPSFYESESCEPKKILRECTQLRIKNGSKVQNQATKLTELIKKLIKKTITYTHLGPTN